MEKFAFLLRIILIFNLNEKVCCSTTTVSTSVDVLTTSVDTTTPVDTTTSLDTTTLIDTTTYLDTTTLIETTTSLDTTTLIDTTTSLDITTLVDTTTSLDITTLIGTTISVDTTTLIDTTTSLDTTTLIDTTTLVDTTTSEIFTTTVQPVTEIVTVTPPSVEEVPAWGTGLMSALGSIVALGSLSMLFIICCCCNRCPCYQCCKQHEMYENPYDTEDGGSYYTNEYPEPSHVTSNHPRSMHSTFVPGITTGNVHNEGPATPRNVTVYDESESVSDKWNPNHNSPLPSMHYVTSPASSPVVTRHSTYSPMPGSVKSEIRPANVFPRYIVLGRDGVPALKQPKIVVIKN